MREIDVNIIKEKVAELCIDTCINLPEDVLSCIKKSLQEETSAVGKDILNQILNNSNIAKKENLPLCQDTGFAIFFVEIGQDVHLTGGDINVAINDGVRSGYKKGYLRKSIVKDPLSRKNTGDNTPAIIHYEMVPGDNVKITFCPKGGGSENMSRIAMMKPADGWDGIEEFIIETVKNAGANPCPPVVVGVGIGGTFDMAPTLAKKAIIRNIDDKNSDSFYSQKEDELLERINKLNIGPAGLGGKTTALTVKINVHPCHIASLPVAINIQCHSSRHKEIII